MSVLKIVFFATLCCSALASVHFRNCDKQSRDACRVHQLHITQCQSAKKITSKCYLKQGQNFSIFIKITPGFNATNLMTNVYWNVGIKEWPLKILTSDDACTFTKCPAIAGRTQTLTYNVTSTDLIKFLPPSSYSIKWKMWNTEDENQICCFQTRLLKRRHRIELRKNLTKKKKHFKRYP